MTRLREDAETGAVETEANSSTEPLNNNNSKQDLATRFNKLVTNLINAYDKYYNQQTKELNNPETNNATTSTNLNQSISKSTLFDQFIGVLDELAEFVLLNKRENLPVFMSLFQPGASLVTIQFYEFVNRLLNVHGYDNHVTAATSNNANNNEYLLTHMMGVGLAGELNKSNMPHEKCVIVSRALQLLNILTSNQNHENSDEDEATLVCCDLLAKSFNFTSSIARLLLTNFSSQTTTMSSEAVLSDKNVRVAFHVLNKLTSNNRLFGVDAYVKQFVYHLVNKIASNDFQLMHLQFISNVIRNDTEEIEKIIKSSNKLREFFRQLVLTIKEKSNKNLALNALIVLLKFKYEDFFTVIWPISGSTKPAVAAKPSRLSNFHGPLPQPQPHHPPPGLSLFTPFDFAMSELCDESSAQPATSTSSSVDILDKHALHSNKFLLISNSINFLFEAVKSEHVRKLLENNENYTNLFLFKLNQFLIENKLSATSKLPMSISTKIVMIFNMLAENSDRLATKLLHIIFDTRHFVESMVTNNTGGGGSGGGGGSVDISTKLKNLILSNSGPPETTTATATGNRRKAASNATSDKNNLNSKYNVIVNFYSKVCEFGLIETTRFFQNSTFIITTLKFLFNLFKKHEWRAASVETETTVDLVNHVDQIYVKLASNITYIKTAMQTRPDECSTGAQVERVLFYNVCVMDSMAKGFDLASGGEMEHQLTWVHTLLELVETNEWMRSPALAIRTLADQELAASAANALALVKLITRLCFYNPQTRRFAFSKTSGKELALKQEAFDLIKALSFFVSSQDQHHYVYKQVAYELLFELHEISLNKTEFNYHFPLQTYLRLEQTVRSNGVGEMLNQKSLFSDSVATAATAAPQRFSQPPTANLKEANTELGQLFAFYDFKLAEQKHQEQLMMNMLNTHFSKSLQNELECKTLRDALRLYAQREITLKAELTGAEQRRGEFEAKQRELQAVCARLKESVAESARQSAAERAAAEERYTALRTEYEQLEKENDECVEELSKNLDCEKAAKKELQAKLKEVHQKLGELEKQRETAEGRRREVEAELDACRGELHGYKDSLTQKTDEHDKLKVEHEKLKAILSYVKENYK